MPNGPPRVTSLFSQEELAMIERARAALAREGTKMLGQSALGQPAQDSLHVKNCSKMERETADASTR